MKNTNEAAGTRKCIVVLQLYTFLKSRRTFHHKNDLLVRPFHTVLLMWAKCFFHQSQKKK